MSAPRRRRLLRLRQFLSRFGIGKTGHGPPARELAHLERSVAESASPGRGQDRRQRVLWISFFAAVLPLAVLLGLQYLWLQELEQTSMAARHRSMAQQLEFIDEALGYQYSLAGGKILSLPSRYLPSSLQAKKDAGDLVEEDWVAAHFEKFQKKLGLARTSFVVDFRAKGDGLSVFDPQKAAMVQPSRSPEVRAIIVAVAPFRVLFERGEKLEVIDGVGDLVVDERDSRYRLLLYPITDREARPVGVAGLVLDEDYLVEKFLPSMEKKILYRTRDYPGLSLVVLDQDGKRRYQVGKAKLPKHLPTKAVAPGEEEDGPPRLHPSFVFQDWRLELHGSYTRPEQWARANFISNLTLTLVLAGVLLGGIVLALRAAAREMRLSQMKHDFVSNVSHELRTPLASIRVFGEFLRLGRVDDEKKIREYGEYIETESRRLTGLINNILDFSRIESGEKLYHFEEADLGEVVSKALSTFEVRLKQCGFELEYRGPATSLPLFELDPAAVRQALCNLLDNAMKYSNGSREIVVSLERRGADAVLSVQDRGIGISRQEQRKIFERFHRAASSLVHDVKGSGLGLSIVAHVIHAHGGEVRVESAPGEGSVFSLHFPLQPSGGPGLAEGEGAGLPAQPQEIS